MFQIKSELRCLFKVPSVCRVVDVLLLFFGKRRMQNEHVHSRKHTTFRFLQPFPSFIHYSRAEYMLSRMCSQLLYPQRIFHEACQLLYIFNPLCILQKGPDAPSDPHPFKEIIRSSRALPKSCFFPKPYLFCCCQCMMEYSTCFYLDFTGYTQNP